MSDLVKQHQDKEGIWHLTLNRPDKRNALNIALMKELCRCFEQASKDHSKRVILLDASGPAFCAGLDLAEAAQPKLEEESGQLVAHLLRAVYECEAVTIAAVHGSAIAGGAGLMAAFDLVIATEKTQIGFPECRRGLIAAEVAAILIRQLSGRALRELLLLGELVDARTAFRMGLINRVVAEEELLPTARQLADQVLLGAPGAQRRTKKMLDTLTQPLAEDLLKMLPFHMAARQSPEAQEGLAAFLEKRQPNW